MSKSRKGTYQGRCSKGWRVPPPTESPARATRSSTPQSQAPGPGARALPGWPLTGPSALTPGPSALSPESLGNFGALPRCPPGTSIALPRSPPCGPSLPQAPARQRSPAPPPTPRSPLSPDSRTRSGRTPASAQTRQFVHAPPRGKGTCGMTSPPSPTKQGANTLKQPARNQGQIIEDLPL